MGGCLQGISVNEKTIHTGRNVCEADLLQSSILPGVCAGGAGMSGRVEIVVYGIMTIAAIF